MYNVYPTYVYMYVVGKKDYRLDLNVNDNSQKIYI